MSRQRRNSALRLARQSNIPHDVDSKIAQAWRVTKEIVRSYHYFQKDPDHFRDGPAKRRFEQNRRRLGELIALLRKQHPDQGEAVDSEIKTYLLKETL